MKYLLITLLLLACLRPAFAQSTPVEQHLTTPDQYCTLIARGGHYGALQFQLDYGYYATKYTGITAEQAKADQAKIKEFFSMADVLNYLSGRGWDLVSVSTLLSDISYPESSRAHSIDNVTATVHSEVQYLLRRKGQ